MTSPAGSDFFLLNFTSNLRLARKWELSHFRFILNYFMLANAWLHCSISFARASSNDMPSTTT